MKKYQERLLKLASKFGNKYAESQTLQQIIEAAAGWGEQSSNGIMNYPALLKSDNASLSYTVNVSSGLMGGKNVDVTNLQVNPPQLASKYAKLPDQIKKYLDKHISSFPQIEEGSFNISAGENNADHVAAN